MATTMRLLTEAARRGEPGAAIALLSHVNAALAEGHCPSCERTLTPTRNLLACGTCRIWWTAGGYARPMGQKHHER